LYQQYQYNVKHFYEINFTIVYAHATTEANRDSTKLLDNQLQLPRSSSACPITPLSCFKIRFKFIYLRIMNSYKKVSSTLYNLRPSGEGFSYMIKKNPPCRDSPPAAGRGSDMLPLRRSAIIAFLLYSKKYDIAI